MKVYLAGSGWTKMWLDEGITDFYRLETFYHISKKEASILTQYKGFLLDSGAFTFMSSKKDAKINWDEYIESYAKFINTYGVQYFFELDIDVLVGLEEVERLRAKLEHLTGKKPIPVWHVSRGTDYWKKMCEEYPYVAIGGIVTGEIPRKAYKYFPSMISYAHKQGALVHGLGFTNIKLLQHYKFDSVDSTSWLSGARYGTIYMFLRGQMMTKSIRDFNAHDLNVHNFNEWRKYQAYAEEHL